MINLNVIAMAIYLSIKARDNQERHNGGYYENRESLLFLDVDRSGAHKKDNKRDSTSVNSPERKPSVDTSEFGEKPTLTGSID